MNTELQHNTECDTQVDVVVHNGIGEITLSGDSDNPYTWDELEDDLHYSNMFIKNVLLTLEQEGEHVKHIYSIHYNSSSNIQIKFISSDEKEIYLDNTFIYNIVNVLSSIENRDNTSINIVNKEIKMTKQRFIIEIKGFCIEIVNMCYGKQGSILEFIV